MSSASDFVIENGVLTKYTGPGGDVVIPESVTSIGDRAFHSCKNLTGVTIPEGVTSIGIYAFCNCINLTSVTIPEGVTSIGDSAFLWCKSLKSVMISKRVKSIENEAFSCCDNLQLIKSTLVPDYSNAPGCCFALMLCGEKPKWRAFSARTNRDNITEFVKPGKWDRYDSELINNGPAYKYKLSARLAGALGRLLDPVELTDENRSLYEELLNKNAKKLLSFAEEMSETGIIEALFSLRVLDEKTAGQVLKRLAASPIAEFAELAKTDLLSIAAPLREEQPKPNCAADKLCVQIMEKSGQNERSVDLAMRDYYSLRTSNLSFLTDREGRQVSKTVFAWLLTAHETVVDSGWPRGKIVSATYQKPALCPEASRIVDLLDPQSLQTALIHLADVYLGRPGRSKMMFLAWPICRYADEATMAELTKRAPKWASSVSGDNAPGLWTFREANVYSNTRAAMLFAEKYHELDEYAALRGMTEDELRDKYLSDVGLDEKGGKVYDLGNRTVTARLQKDLGFLFELPDGKTAKSLPKKGADPAKFEAAKADFDEMRKSIRKIVKSRSDVLFADFLSGRGRLATDWREAYLKNPLLRGVAELLVWAQGGKAFTLGAGGPIDSAGNAYTIGEEPILLAHPMEMEREEVTAWQKYFTRRGLRQPFLQIWEPVIDPATIREDRYEGSVQPMYRFSGKDKHGIHSGNLHAFSEDIGFSLDGCELDYKASTWRINYDGADGETYTLGKFSFKTYTRQVNHIVSLLDKWTAEDRVKKDDVTVMDLMDAFTLAQVTEFIKAAQETQAVNVLALLLEYKNAHFADFDPMDEFVLE